jgi:hypothetical protein
MSASNDTTIFEAKSPSSSHHSGNGESEKEVNKDKMKSKKEMKESSKVRLQFEWMKKFLIENNDLPVEKQLKKFEEIGMDCLKQIEKQSNKKPKDHPPKRTAYQIWMDEEKDNPILQNMKKPTDRMVLLKPLWKEFKESTSKADKKRMTRLKEQAEKEKAFYDAWKSTHEIELTLPIKKGKDYPSKPQNAKGLFKIAMRKKRKVELRKEHGLSSKKKLNGKITEKLNAELEEKWKGLSTEKKKKWEELHEEKMKEWKKKCEAYVEPKEESSFEISS